MNRDKPKLCERALQQILMLQQEHPSLESLDVRHLVTAMKSWADEGESEKVERDYSNSFKTAMKREMKRVTTNILCKSYSI